jgi:hypothetical protein
LEIGFVGVFALLGAKEVAAHEGLTTLPAMFVLRNLVAHASFA